MQSQAPVFLAYSFFFLGRCREGIRVTTLADASEFLVIVPSSRPGSPCIVEASSDVYEIHYMPNNSGSQSSIV
jgi:hypothetical protein